MKISIIIPTFKRQTSLKRLLESITKQGYPKNDFEIIIADDQSGEDLSNLIGSYKEKVNVRWIISKIKGRPGARNTGAKAAKGEIIIFLDDDMEIEKGFIDFHKRMHINAKCIVSGCIKASGNSTGLWNAVTDSRFDLRDDKINIRKPSFTTVFTGNMSVLNQIFRELNMFDEIAFSYYGGEDFDFGIRCIQAGIPIAYCGDAVAIHHEKQWTKKYFCDYIRWAAYSMATLVKKHKTSLLSDPAMVGFPCKIPGIYIPQQNLCKYYIKRILQTKLFIETGLYCSLLLWWLGLKQSAVRKALFIRKILYEKDLQIAIYELFEYSNKKSLIGYSGM